MLELRPPDKEHPGLSSNELEERITRIEKAQNSRGGTFLKYIASPLLLLIIGSILNSRLEDARRDFQRIDLETKQIDAAQRMLNELFSGVPERAFIADRLMSKLLDSKLSAEVSTVMAKYYSQKINTSIRGSAFEDVDKVAAAAEAIGGPAAEKVSAGLRQTNFYLVTGSLPRSRKEDAIQLARDLSRKGYDSAVYDSSSGYLTVTVGHLPLEEARKLRSRALDARDISNDSYLIPGKTFDRKIYPR